MLSELIKDFPASVVVSVLILLWSVHLLSTRQKKGSPPLIRGLPWIGVALSLRDAHAFFVSCERRFGSTFSIILFGRKIHVLLTSESTIFKNNKSLSFREIERWIDDSFFAYPSHLDDAQFHTLENQAKGNLISRDAVQTLTHAYLEALTKSLKQSLPEVKSSQEASHDLEIDDLFEWVRKRVYSASSLALYGNSFPVQESREAYWKWEQNLSSYLFLPDCLSRLLGARKTLHATMERVIIKNGGSWTNASRLIRERMATMREWGFSTLDQAKLSVDVLFGLQANATPMAFWFLAHILTSPRLTARLREVIREREGQVLDIIQDPWVQAVYYECLRVHSHSSIIRKCIETTELPQGLVVQKGEYILLPTATIHHLPSRFPNPELFDESRFSDAASHRLVLSFGGGAHYCPGRFFAMNEIVSFTVLFFQTFDFEVDESTRVPNGWDKMKYGQGSQQPLDRMKIKIRPKLDH